MINFFRNIRRQLANENKFQKYFRYAFGEILLVVIGILIALQVNNWNEKRKQQKQFDILISKVYTIINSNTQLMYTFSNRSMQDFRLLEYFINYKNPDSNIFKLEEIREHFTSDTSYNDPLLNFNVTKFRDNEIEPWKFPHLLYLLERNYWTVINTNVLKYYSDQINLYSSSEIQNQLALNIQSYYDNALMQISYSKTSRVASFLKNEFIPEPRTLEGASANINNLNRHYFTEKEIIKVEQLLQEAPLKAELRTLLRHKTGTLDGIQYMHDMGKTILSSIKNQYPDVRLNYPNLGIIGNALDGWNLPARPMALTNADSLIWEIDVTLKNGGIKFKSDNSWTNHWGGSEFPKDGADFWGNDILVKPGKYHVILNLTENTYEFIKLDD